MRLSAAAIPAAQFRHRKIGLDAAVVGLGVNTCGEGARQGKVDAAAMRVEVELASLGAGHLDMDAAVMGGAGDVAGDAGTMNAAVVLLGLQRPADAGDVDAAVVSGNAEAGFLRREGLPSDGPAAVVPKVRARRAEQAASDFHIDLTGEEPRLKPPPRRWPSPASGCAPSP